MSFKSDKQRKAVMAKLAGEVTSRSRPLTPQIIKDNKNSSYNDLKKKGIILKPNKDYDKDGVKNKFDCKPLNKKEQGKIHSAIKKVKNSKEFKELKDTDKKKLNKSLNKLSKVKNQKGLKAWVKEHGRDIRTIALALGVTALAPIFGIFSGVLGAAILLGGISTPKKKK